MFIVKNRYLVINSADGHVFDYFDSGKEAELKEYIEKLCQEGFSMYKHYVLDRNKSGSFVPCMIWLHYYEESE